VRLSCGVLLLVLDCLERWGWTSHIDSEDSLLAVWDSAITAVKKKIGSGGFAVVAMLDLWSLVTDGAGIVSARSGEHGGVSEGFDI
jgi:hypothetical protein